MSIPSIQEFNKIWQGSAAYVTMEAVLQGRHDSVEQYYTSRVDHTAKQCREKWGISKIECIELIKQVEGITDAEFMYVYRGNRF